MLSTVTRVYRFRGQHSLPGFPEPWAYPHEHDYTVEIEVEAGVDTLELDQQWSRGVLKDGVNMNDHFQPSTVEHIAEKLRMEYSAQSVVVREDQLRFARCSLQ